MEKKTNSVKMPNKTKKEKVRLQLYAINIWYFGGEKKIAELNKDLVSSDGDSRRDTLPRSC